MSGFVTAEGNFNIKCSKSKTHKIGYRIELRFRIYQHDRDLKLMELIIKYLGTGKIYKNNKNSVVTLTVHKFEDINKIIIPFFKNYPLHGCKQFDYLKLCKVAKINN